jgi:hypothetical protein
MHAARLRSQGNRRFEADQVQEIHGRRWNTRFARRASARGCDSRKTTPEKSDALIGTQALSLPTWRMNQVLRLSEMRAVFGSLR